MPITISLGDLQERAEALVASGAHASLSDVMRAGLQALEREEAAADVVLRERVKEALDDPRPAIPADEVFARLRAHHEAKVKAATRGA